MPLNVAPHSPSRTAKVKSAIPATTKFSFKSAFASSKPSKHTAADSLSASTSLPTSSSLATTAQKPAVPPSSIAPPSKLAWPATPTDSLSKASKRPTSTITLPSKTTGIAASSASSLGKRSVQTSTAEPVHSAVPSSTVTMLPSHASGPSEFSSVTRSKLSSLRFKLPGPPPARFGTFSGHPSSSASTSSTKLAAASPGAKLSKIARSNSLRDVHGAAAQNATAAASDGGGGGSGRTLNTSSSISSLRSVQSARTATLLPKSRSRTGSNIVHKVDQQAPRKRTQSTTETATTTPSPRKPATAFPAVKPGLSSNGAPQLTPAVSAADTIGGRPATLSQVGNIVPIAIGSLRKMPVQRRPSSVDLGKPHGALSRRASIDRARPPAPTSGALATEVKASKDKENVDLAMPKAGPPPALVAGSGPKAIAKSSAATSVRHKRSSLPIATALLAPTSQLREKPEQPSSVDNVVDAGASQTATSSAPATQPDLSSINGGGGSGGSSSISNTSMTAITTMDRPNLGIASSVLKAHPITHPTVLAMRQRAPHQPIDTPQALMKGKKRLSAVLAHPLDLKGSLQTSSGKAKGAEATAAFTPAAGPAGPAAPASATKTLPRPRAAQYSTSTPPVSPTKGRGRFATAVTFPARGSPPSDGPTSKSRTPAQRKPNGRVLSSAEIDADLLASLQAVARKANLNLKDVETMLAADKLQREHAEGLEGTLRGETWSKKSQRDDGPAANHRDNGHRGLRGTQTPSLSQISLSAVARDGPRNGKSRHEQSSGASEEEAPLENIGDQSLDFRAMASSPIGAESPLLRSSDTLGSPPRPNNELEELSNSAPSDRRGQGRARPWAERSPAEDRPRRTLRESAGLETMLHLRSSVSQHESLLGIELNHSAATLRPGKSTERLSQHQSSLTLMDESFAEDLSETGDDAVLIQGVAATARSALVHQDPTRDGAPPSAPLPPQQASVGGEEEDEARPLASSDKRAMLRELEEQHAREIAELERQLAAMASQLAQATASGSEGGAHASALHGDDDKAFKLQDLQTALDSATCLISESEQERLRLQQDNARLTVDLRKARYEQMKSGWTGITKLGLVELQEIKGQTDACVFWNAQMDLWEGMILRAAERRRTVNG